MSINAIKQLISENYESGKITDSSLIELINHCNAYLNLTKLKDYAKKNNITYNGAKHHRNPITIFNTKFIIDNE